MHAVVLGGGLQGVSAALALAHHGHSVDLVEQDSLLLNRASLRNEGKIHLGYVYANDLSGRTSRLMLEGALAFAPLLEKWLGKTLPWHRWRSHPFTYCVATQSLLSAQQVMAHYRSLEQYFQQIGGSNTLYLGQRLEHFLTPLDPELAVPQLQRSYATPLASTPEVALDLPAFCKRLRQEVTQQPLIRLHLNHKVAQAQRSPHSFRVEGIRADQEDWQLEGDLLVNCLWENRLLVDQQLGYTPSQGWVHRLKYRVLAQTPPALAQLPALTFVLGPFGDIVTYPDGLTYLSYYPRAMRGWSTDPTPPNTWEAACKGQPDPAVASTVAQEVLEALEQVVPGLGRSTVRQVDAGAIFTWGQTDINDPASQLHLRHDTGVHAHDGYFSIDTGKLTTAPLFAQSLTRLLGH
jgi:glycine/D-amino acid oxidase-like deaminating enzyme